MRVGVVSGLLSLWLALSSTLGILAQSGQWTSSTSGNTIVVTANVSQRMAPTSDITNNLAMTRANIIQPVRPARQSNVTGAISTAVSTHPHSHSHSHGHSHHDEASLYPMNFNESWESIRTFKLVDNLDTPLKVYVQKDSRLYKPHYLTHVDSCLRMWSEALDGRLKWQFVSRPEDAQLKVLWRTAFDDPYQAGNTDFTFGDAVVEIKTTGLPDNQIKADILHEFGHALGIANHSHDHDDIMSTSRPWPSQKAYLSYQAQLSQRDVQAIRRLYSLAWNPGEDLYTARTQIASNSR